MRIYLSFFINVMDECPTKPGAPTPQGERFRICEVPSTRRLLSSGTLLCVLDEADVLRVETAGREPRSGVRHSIG
jgi:hypothetical protein